MRTTYYLFSFLIVFIAWIITIQNFLNLLKFEEFSNLTDFQVCYFKTNPKVLKNNGSY